MLISFYQAIKESQLKSDVVQLQDGFQIVYSLNPQSSNEGVQLSVWTIEGKVSVSLAIYQHSGIDFVSEYIDIAKTVDLTHVYICMTGTDSIKVNIKTATRVLSLAKKMYALSKVINLSSFISMSEPRKSLH